MKRKLYLPILYMIMIATIYSCSQKRQKNICNSSRVQDDFAFKLIKEADSLMQKDSLLWLIPVNRKKAYVPIYDSIVMTKLDSALLLNPHLKNAYISKYIYLTRCWRLTETLQLLRKMDLELQEPMGGDMRNFKAILEDRFGSKEIAQADFKKADSIYNLQLIQCETKESSLHDGYRILKALNLSLMKNDFEHIKKELEYYNKTHETPIKGMEEIERFTTKYQYYDYLFKADSIAIDERRNCRKTETHPHWLAPLASDMQRYRRSTPRLY